MLKKNAQNKGLENVCTFIEHDATDLSFLPEDKRFDFIIDWAAIHCIPKDLHKKYTQGISGRLQKNGLLLLRTFTTDDGREFFIEEIDGLSEKVYLLKEDYIKNLYKGFEVVDKNISQPKKYQDLKFIELLLQKK